VRRGPAREKYGDAAACLCFLNYLAFLQPEADRTYSVLPWVVTRGRSNRFLWANSIIQKKKCEEGPSNSGLFSSKRSKPPLQRFKEFTGREEFNQKELLERPGWAQGPGLKLNQQQN
jgi:hypothetical protein